jgi:RHS repeat-associated protein
MRRDNVRHFYFLNCKSFHSNDLQTVNFGMSRALGVFDRVAQSRFVVLSFPGNHDMRLLLLLPVALALGPMAGHARDRLPMASRTAISIAPPTTAMREAHRKLSAHVATRVAGLGAGNICYEGNPSCPPPNVTITPGGGTFSSASQSITVDWCGHTQLASGTREIRVNGVLVTSSFTYTTSARSGCTAHASSTGTVTLPAGNSTVTAYIEDNVSQIGTASASFTYTAVLVTLPPPPPSPPSSPPPSPPAPGAVVSVTDANPGSNWDRDQCFTVSGGPGVAYECGDLRLAHGLPGVQAYGAARSMSMLYNSRTASATPVIAAYVHTPADIGAPVRVTAELLVGPLNGTKTVRASGEWTAADFTPASPRRIAFTYSGAAEPSGVYTYQVTVHFWNSSSNIVRSVTSEEGELVLVNRSASPYGPGWWPSGVEQLINLANGDKAWIGADGSTRHYVKRTVVYAWDQNVWDAGAVDRPDYLSYDGTNYYRWAPHRTRIVFNAQGQHIATINRYGRTTSFAYLNGALDSVAVPGLSMALYRFSYSSAQIAIVAPPINGPLRASMIQRDADGIRSICDPDAGCTSYTYTNGPEDGERNLSSIYDRRGMRTDVHLYGGHFLRVMTRDAAGTPSTQSFVPVAEAGGLSLYGQVTASTNTDRCSMVYGPRNVGDWIYACFTRFGAPTVISNAGLTATQLVYGDARFPGLVTQTTSQSGFVTNAAYDASGHLQTVIARNPHDDIPVKDDTTTYTWDTSAWDEVTSVRMPEGETTNFNIDATTGYRLWQEMPAVAGSRVQFRYTSEGLLQAVQHPTLNSPTPPTDSVAYDTLRNVALTTTPKGYRTRFSHDAIGRLTATAQQITPGDIVNFQLDSTVYDIMGRVTKGYQYGPGMNIGTGLSGGLATYNATSLSVTNFYGATGDLDSTTRAPNVGQVTTLTTRYKYDALGRVVKVVAPDLTFDSTAYDLAGNALTHRTRNGDLLSSTYDALNRLASSTIPQKTLTSHNAFICEIADCGQHPDPYPHYDISAAGHLTFGGETATFRYDLQTGQLDTASNPTALVTRTFYRNGDLKTETQHLRTVVTGTIDPGVHEYTMSFRYDRNGRRLGLTVPDAVRPRNSAGAVLGSEIQYTYRTDNGALSTITDLLGNGSIASYNARGERWQTSLPGAVITDGFDDDGQLATSSALWQGGTQLRADAMTYDARGKMTSMAGTAGPHVVVQSWFTGLGQLAHSHSESWDETWVNQTFNTDEYFGISALGDVEGSTIRTNYRYGTSGAWGLSDNGNTQSTTPKSFVYNTANDELQEQAYGNRDDTFEYDAAGNTLYMRGYDNTPQASGTVEERASFHDASGRLRVTDTRQGFTNPFARTFEESFYDALGRRVLVRTRRACQDPSTVIDKYCELSTVRRTIWDGNAELAEIQQPGGDAATPADMENDGALTTRQPTRAGDTFNPNPFFGTTVYTYGLHGTDHPVSAIRLNYIDWSTPSTPVAFAPFTITPLWNAIGQMDVAVYPDGFRTHTEQGKIVKLQFPTAWFAYYRSRYLAQAWLGTLLEDKRDASGLHYRRNRFYDPMTGRFTQEDPIGLAGGLNAYGFANGDPVNFSDPFGTCPVPADDCPPGYFTAIGVGLGGILGGVGGGTGGFFAGFGIGALPGAAGGMITGATYGGLAGAYVDGLVNLSKISSAGKMQREVERGRAPKEVDRVDKGNPDDPGDKDPHVHLKDTRALKQDGTWKEGAGEISKAVANWLTSHGWGIP